MKQPMTVQAARRIQSKNRQNAFRHRSEGFICRSRNVCCYEK